MNAQNKLKVLLIGFGSIAKKHAQALLGLDEYKIDLSIVSKSLALANATSPRKSLPNLEEKISPCQPKSGTNSPLHTALNPHKSKSHQPPSHAKTPLEIIGILPNNATLFCTQIFASLKDVPYLSDYDYFIIANETSLHFSTLEFLTKHVLNKIILCEKPLFHKAMPFTPSSNKVFLGYQLRTSPIILALKQELAAREVYFATFNCHSFLPKWRRADYKSCYSASAAKGGGVEFDLSHELDLALFLLGEMSVAFASCKRLSELEITSNDLAHFVLRKKGVQANVTVDYFSRFDERCVKLFCKDASIRADLLQGSLEIFSTDYKRTQFLVDNISNITALHKDILSQQGTACTLQEGLFLMTQIKKARSFS